MQIQCGEYIIKPMHEIKAEMWLKFHQENRFYVDNFSTTKLSDYYTLEIQQKFVIQSVIDFERDEGYAFGVLSHNSKKILAKVKTLRDTNWNHNYVTLRILIDYRYRNIEFGSLVLKSIIDFLFKNRGVHIIYAPTLPDDVYTIQLLTQFNFFFEGRLQKAFHVNGEWKDHLLYALINEGSGR